LTPCAPVETEPYRLKDGGLSRAIFTADDDDVLVGKTYLERKFTGSFED
jgi:hypothetical protein